MTSSAHDAMRQETNARQTPIHLTPQLRYVAAALVNIYRRRRALSGLRRVYATPLLSHFTARFEPIGSDAAPANDASLAKAPAAAPAPAGEAAAV